MLHKKRSKPKRGAAGRRELFQLGGREIWVVGGAGYLGQPVVRLLASLGARVVCADLGDRAERFVAQHSLGPKVIPVSLDVRDTASVKTFAGERMGRRGVPHGLVMMAYASTGKTFADLTEAEFDEVNHSNLTASFVLVREVGQAMAKAGRGSLVLFSSMYGSVSPDPRVYEAPMVPNPIEYGVNKAGIQQMTRYLAVHWGGQGVRVNCISPGPFPNPGVQQQHPAFIKRLTAKVPLGRIGQAPEIAGAVAFLLSDAASFVTGHNLAVDGGWTSW